MAVGYPVTTQAMDTRVGQIVQTLRETFAGVPRVKEYLDARTDQQLMTEFGYSAEDVTLLKSAITDLENLRQTAYGQRAQTPASNFFFFADKLTGIV